MGIIVPISPPTSLQDIDQRQIMSFCFFYFIVPFVFISQFDPLRGFCYFLSINYYRPHPAILSYLPLHLHRQRYLRLWRYIQTAPKYRLDIPSSKYASLGPNSIMFYQWPFVLGGGGFSPNPRTRSISQFRCTRETGQVPTPLLTMHLAFSVYFISEKFSSYFTATITSDALHCTPKGGPTIYSNPSPIKCIVDHIMAPVGQ